MENIKSYGDTNCQNNSYTQVINAPKMNTAKGKHFSGDFNNYLFQLMCVPHIPCHI